MKFLLLLLIKSLIWELNSKKKKRENQNWNKDDKKMIKFRNVVLIRKKILIMVLNYLKSLINYIFNKNIYNIKLKKNYK